MKECIIIVKNEIGKNCVHSCDGDIIRFKIENILHKGNTVKLDFTGTKQWSYEFMRHALGNLINKVAYQDMMDKIKIDGASHNAMSIASLAVNDSYKKYCQVI